MHVVTFYSYKGGTGRSMALVNVAVELVKTGRRVMIVDFDLEAPGLDTFNLPRPQSASKGVVDFVLEYSQTGESPDVSEFVYKSAIPNADGQLWVMPSGKPDSNYDSRFRSINWLDLYENHDGYILFEDLKAQWKTQFAPDYVLIDSRTGHTDVGGICTRQLPDVVVLFFFPNEQNRRGLESIASQIRRESEGERKKDIKLLFVMSNVPELDDEEGFLASNVAKLKETLKFDSLTAVIHHYSSLALLTQCVFALDRPRTRLAQEYRDLAREIRRSNMEDREAAIEFLEEIAPLARQHRIPVREVEQRITDIRTRHMDDPDVLVRLAVLLRQQRRFQEALALLERAGELGAKSPQLYLARAEVYALTRDPDAASKDVVQLLELDNATYWDVRTAVRLLLQLDPGSLKQLSQTPAFKKLDAHGQYHVAAELMDSRSALPVASAVLQQIYEQLAPESDLVPAVQESLVLTLIGQGQYAAAESVINPKQLRVESELEIADVFNYAMAQWGLTSRPPLELFRRIVELDQIKPQAQTNPNQCLAIALGLLGDTNRALERLGEAWQQTMTKRTPEFSAWSYLRAAPDAFLDDLKEIQQLIAGESITPRFMREQANKRI